MHLGNVYAALLAWLSARSQDGGFVLRIEDIDTQRSRPEYAAQIDDDLRWLGLDWDERHVQSQRSEHYAAALSRLEAMGLTYPCRCTRADILATQAPHESDGRVVYQGTCRPQGICQRAAELFNNVGQCAAMLAVETNTITSNAPAAIRLAVPDADITFTDRHYGPQHVNLARHCGDFVLRRKDGAWAYQLAVAVDDAEMGVTEVVRGRDLLLSTAQQLYIYRLLGVAAPRYCHFPLLLGDSGQRLSKRDAALDMGELRQRYTPQQLVGRLACLAGLTPMAEPVTPRELLEGFDWERVPRHDIVADSLTIAHDISQRSASNC